MAFKWNACRLSALFQSSLYNPVIGNLSIRYFSKKVKINKTEIMKEWRGKYDRSELKKDYEITVPSLDRLDVQCCRSSGPGGQNVNKVATKVEVRIDLNDCNWIPDEVKERLKNKEKGRINKLDEFILVSDTHRTQYDNKNEAHARLQEIIDNCCYPERDHIESEMPKEYKELIKEKNLQKKNQKNKNKDMKARGW